MTRCCMERINRGLAYAQLSNAAIAVLSEPPRTRHERIDVMEPVTLAKQIKEFFGMSASECMREYKQLSEADKQYFVEEFNRAGMPTILKGVSE